MASLTTPEMKYYVLAYYRFQRQNSIAATEVGVFGNFIADVLASDGKEFTEVEIKISESDFMADFSHKSEKHTAYLDTTINKVATLKESDRAYMPTRFYYAVPKELVRTALSLVKDTPYGLMYVDPNDPKLSMNGAIKIVKHSAIINRTYPKKLEKRAIARMSSELVNLYQTMLDL